MPIGDVTQAIAPTATIAAALPGLQDQAAALLGQTHMPVIQPVQEQVAAVVPEIMS